MNVRSEGSATNRGRGRVSAAIAPAYVISPACAITPAYAIALALLLTFSVACSGGDDGSEGNLSAPPRLRVFAAASLQDAVSTIDEIYAETSGVRFEHNFAGSNTLALQIEASQAADVFISADEAWVDHVIEDGAADGTTKRPILSNRLVIVGRPDGIPPFAELGELGQFDVGYGSSSDTASDTASDIEADTETALHSDFRIAIADPEAVPAGRYARAALQIVPAKHPRSLFPFDLMRGITDLDTVTRERQVPTSDVRAALALAEADPMTVAIVYASDVRTSDVLRILHHIDPRLHPKIVYWAVATGEGAPATRKSAIDYLDHLVGAEAQTVFVEFGFERH